MSGVERETVWLHRGDPPVFEVYAHDADAEPGRWFPEPVAAALVAVADAAFAMRAVVIEHMAAGEPVGDYTDATKQLYEALDAARAQESAT